MSTLVWRGHQTTYTVEPFLKAHPIGHKNVVCQDRWSLVIGSVLLKCTCRSFCWKCMVCRDRWSLMAVVSQDRFHCNHVTSIGYLHVKFVRCPIIILHCHSFHYKFHKIQVIQKLTMNLYRYSKTCPHRLLTRSHERQPVLKEQIFLQGSKFFRRTQLSCFFITDILVLQNKVIY